MAVVSFLLVFVLCVASSIAAKLPSDFTRCKIGADDFDECLKKALDAAIKTLSAKALPKYGIAQIDPIIIPEMTIGAGSMAVNLEQKYMNVKTYGYSNSTVEKAHLDLKEKQLTFTVNVPHFVLDLNYEVNGKILLIPVVGKGPAKFSLDGCLVKHTLTFEQIVKKEKTYLDIIAYDIDIKTKKAQFKFDNLFDGNKELSESIHRVVNENWEVVYDDVISGYNKAYSSLFLLYAKSFFGKVPLNEVFPQ